ncbi:DUF3060 domain-containing protein [Methylobacterium sp. M6A4_1b]
MPRFLPLVLAAVLVQPSLACAEALTIEGVGISRDVDCGGNDVGIYGAENAIVLTGRCGLITVHGSKHTVSFEEGAAVAVSGADIRVTGGRTQDVTVSVAQNSVTATLGSAGSPGTLDVSGAQNRVSLVLAGPTRFTVQGADHAVEWTRSEGVPNPQVQASGIKNTIKRKP